MVCGFDNLRTAETEKKHKYDFFANHAASMYKNKLNLLLYVIAWDDVVTN